MAKTTSWREIRARRPPNEAAVARERFNLRLAMLREQLGKSQADLAETLGTSQPNVSQLERSEDLQLSSVAKYVHALGGQLQVNAVVGPTTIRLMDDFDDVAPSHFVVMIFQGKVRPNYMRSLGPYDSLEAAWAFVDREGYSTAQSDGEWAVVAP